MMRRRRRRKAVAATLASVLVFSSLLAVNQIVYSSENQWLRAVSVAEMEHAEGLNSRILAATAVFDMLLGAQTLPQQTAPLSCEGNKTMMTVPGRNVSATADRSSTKSIHGVSYSLNVSMRPVDVGPASTDNLTILGPFAGFQVGSLNFVVHISMRATAGPGDPYYSKSETHFVHLPVLVDLSRQRCLSVPGKLPNLGSGRSCCDSALGLLASCHHHVRPAATNGLDPRVIRSSGSGLSCAV